MQRILRFLSFIAILQWISVGYVFLMDEYDIDQKKWSLPLHLLFLFIVPTSLVLTPIGILGVTKEKALADQFHGWVCLLSGLGFLTIIFLGGA